MMNRRIFLESATLIGAAALLPPLPTFARQPKYKMGLQLFTVHSDMLKDTKGTLKIVQSFGYEDFEIFGFDPTNESFYGIPASEFKTMLDELNITASSGHFGFSPFLNKSDDELKRFVDACISGAKSLNLKYITWPWISPEQRTRENFLLMGERLNVIGEQVTQAGLGFAYHNHGFEFDDYNGESGFDILLKATEPSLVKFQMDMYWVMHAAKYTPKQLVEQLPGRIVMWHIKDMDKVTRDYTELGNGSIDYKKILPDPEKSGLEYYYLEQGGNFAVSPLKSVEVSAQYFKKNLQKLL